MLSLLLSPHESWCFTNRSEINLIWEFKIIWRHMWKKKSQNHEWHKTPSTISPFQNSSNQQIVNLHSSNILPLQLWLNLVFMKAPKVSSQYSSKTKFSVGCASPLQNYLYFLMVDKVLVTCKSFKDLWLRLARNLNNITLKGFMKGY